MKMRDLKCESSCCETVNCERTIAIVRYDTPAPLPQSLLRVVPGEGNDVPLKKEKTGRSGHPVRRVGRKMKESRNASYLPVINFPVFCLIGRITEGMLSL